MMVPAMLFAQGLTDKKTCRQRAEKMYQLIWEHYRVKKYIGLLSENFPADTQTKLDYFQGDAVKQKEVSFLWPFSAMMSATNALLHIPGERKHYLNYLDSLTAGMEAYKDSVRKPAGYQAYPAGLEHSDRYYDDNGLVGIEYAEAYRNTKDPAYLQKAETVFKFILSGWTDELGGGVYWVEGHTDQKPACSNGMDMLVALKIYTATKDTFYLNWGLRFYNWMNADLKSPNGLYYNDKKTKNGDINPTFYSYNTGSMLEASVMLYQITHERKYLDAAQATARDAFSYFHNQKHDDHLNIRIDLPWFMTVLFRGYEALYKVDNDPQYINAIHHDLDYAWQYTRDKYGLLTHDWTANPSLVKKSKWLLDEACIAELYARLSY
jgi:mannose/cellobiose epimerase-like protein (N-acyl-D-glucosamine 2-epimerase family)